MKSIDILGKLIQLKTVKGNTEEFKKLYSFVVNQLPKSMRYEFFESNGERSLYAYSKSRERPDILLNAHIDVVPAPDDMFEMKKRGNRVKGRGVYDMKFAIASFIDALNSIDLESKNIALLLTSDEEVGGRNGAGFFMKQNIKPKFVFTPDGAGLNSIETHAKGVAMLKISAKGKSAHSSRKWLGKSANEVLISCLSEIQGKLDKKCVNNCDHWHYTFNVGTISGGTATNKVSEYAEATMDFRYVKKSELELLDIIIKSLLAKHKQVSAKYIIREPVFEMIKNDYVSIWINIVKKHTKRKVTEEKSHGASDARYFSNKKIPVLITRPIGGDIHTDSEWLDLKSFLLFNKILKEFIESL